MVMEGVSQGQIRCFVAIEIPETIQDLLISVQDELKTKICGASWVKRGNLHLTLRFLGDVAPDQIGVIKNVIEQVAGNYPPFSMQIGGIGAFPNPTRPRVIWAGVKTSVAEITTIVQEINIELSCRGRPLDEKLFRPHITLARLKGRIDLTPFVRMFQQYDAIDGTTVAVHRIGLIQSQLHASGAVHIPLETCSLNNCLTAQS